MRRFHQKRPLLKKGMVHEMIYESKCRRRTRLRIDDLIDELGRTLTYDEIKTEFAKRGFPRPFRKVVEDIFLKI